MRTGLLTQIQRFKRTRNSSQAPLCTRRCQLPARNSHNRGNSLVKALWTCQWLAPGTGKLPVYLYQRPEICSYFRNSSGTLPPFSASFCMTCLCSQMFIDAESFLSPVK
jgi:hypothetical protein